MEYYLMPQYKNVKSYGNKAVVKVTENSKLLKSYNVLVCSIINDKVVVYGTYSNTTLRHIKEFLLQNGFKAESKKQIESDYMGGSL